MEQVQKNYTTNYENMQRVQSLLKMKRSSTVFLIAKVISVSKVESSSLKKNEDQNDLSNSNVDVKLTDGTGEIDLILYHPTISDSKHESEAKKKSIEFFEKRVNCFVYILNAKAAPVSNNKVFIYFNQWAQYREITDDRITRRIEVDLSTHIPAHKNEPIADVEFSKIISITPNLKYVNIEAKIVNVQDFKRARGFLASNQPQNNAKDYIRVTFTDASGTIYGVFPKLPKFESLQKGSIVQLISAKVEKFDSETAKDEKHISLTIFIYDERHKSSNGSIKILPFDENHPLNSIPTNEIAFEEDILIKDPHNVSKKIWIVKAAE